MISGFFLGWMIADLLGGIAHWLEDRVLSERLPVIGKHVVVPNRLHHAEPLAFLKSSWLARNSTTFIAAIAVSAVWAATLGIGPIWAGATVGGLMSNMVHGWAHDPARCGRLIRIAQSSGIIQSPAHHAGHHRPPSTRRYCILTDWLNPWLDGFGVWDRIERLLRIEGAK